MVRGLQIALILGGATVALSACRKEEPPPLAPVVRETPADEIRRIGVVWQSVSERKGIQSPPSKISTFQHRLSSMLRLEPGQHIVEKLIVDEALQLRDGGKFVCRAEGQVNVRIVYGRRSGEAMVQLERPPVRLERACDPPSFPDPQVEIPGGVARFVLRGDRLIAVEPPLEKREYLPIGD